MPVPDAGLADTPQSAACATLIQDPNWTVEVQEWYPDCQHAAPKYTIPAGATVRLNERMAGQPGYLSGQIVVDAAVFVDEQHWMSIEVRNTHKTDPASRPGRMIEVSAGHVNELYDTLYRKQSSGSVTLLPDYPVPSRVSDVLPIRTLQQPLMRWVRRVQKRKRDVAITTLQQPLMRWIRRIRRRKSAILVLQRPLLMRWIRRIRRRKSAILALRGLC